MQPQPITISVSPATAWTFRAASATERRFAEKLLEMFFSRSRSASLAEFRAIAAKAHTEAVERGLTEEIPHDILEDK